MSEMERNNKRRGGSGSKDREARENEMMFKRADINPRDGKVTRQEFTKMMNSMPGKEA